MQGYLLIVVFTVLQLMESVFVRSYGKRHGEGGLLMNAVIAFFAAAFFFVNDLLIARNGFYFPGEMIPIALVNALLYAAGFYSAYVAFMIGPYGLTRLISSFSLMFPIFYGIFVLKEETDIFTYLGIGLIISAMVLINLKKKQKTDEEKDENGVSLKWLIYMITCVFSNGFIAILTRTQQIKFNDACSNEFQMISIGGSFLILLVRGLITDRDKLKYIMKKGILYGAGSGLCCGIKNFVLLAVYLFLPLSTVSPLKTGMSMIASFLFAVLFYKEKYSIKQKIGVVCGVLAVVILAL